MTLSIHIGGMDTCHMLDLLACQHIDTHKYFLPEKLEGYIQACMCTHKNINVFACACHHVCLKIDGS